MTRITIFSNNCLQNTLKISTLDGVKNVEKIVEAAEKKVIVFFLHYKQSVGSNNKPLNVSKRSLITYYSVNYFLHKNHYDFYYAEKNCK